MIDRSGFFYDCVKAWYMHGDGVGWMYGVHTERTCKTCVIYVDESTLHQPALSHLPTEQSLK